MSIIYDVIGATDSIRWPITFECVDNIAAVSELGHDDLLKKLGLARNAELGEEFQLSRKDMIFAVEKLLPIAKGVPKAFQLRMRDSMSPEDQVGRAVSGLMIEGVQYWISCKWAYWTIAPMDAPAADQQIPNGMRGERRREPAEFHTQNVGIVKVEIKKGKPGSGKITFASRRIPPIGK